MNSKDALLENIGSEIVISYDKVQRLRKGQKTWIPVLDLQGATLVTLNKWANSLLNFIFLSANWDAYSDYDFWRDFLA